MSKASNINASDYTVDRYQTVENQTVENQTIESRAEKIVLAARLGSNADVLQEVLAAEAQVQVEPPTVEAVSLAIEEEASLVVLTEDMLTDNEKAQQLGDRLNQQPDWSDIPVIILLTECQRFGDCLTLLGQTTHQRSVLLLERPLKRTVFSSVIETCLRNRQRQYKLRDTLYQLRSSNQALESFSYTAAHELRNPLGIVTSSFDLLARRELAPQQQKLVEMGQRTSQKMNQTLNALLDYSKIQPGTDHFTAVEMASVVKEAITNLQVLIQKRAADVSWIEPLPVVQGNYPLLVQLISNLIKNAVVHQEEHAAKVQILAELQRDRWLIHVKDNGIGIAADNQSKIFELFNRAGKSSAEGSGIGLALCRRIVEQHEGTIGVRSEPGEGSDFYFDLPSSSTNL